MQTIEMNASRMETSNQNGKEREEIQYERWAHCHVNWTGVWVGALSTFGMALLFGLAGIAVGAYVLGPEHRVVDLRKLGIWTLIFSVCSAFFSAVVGGWVAGKIAGILHSEPAMLHGAISWLVAVPIIMAATALGGASVFGGWYAVGGAASGYSASTPYVRPEAPAASATADEMSAYRTQVVEHNQNVQQWREDTPRATRNSAIGALTALLLGLIGSVVGGWLASGEPMNFTHFQTRKPLYHIA